MLPSLLVKIFLTFAGCLWFGFGKTCNRILTFKGKLNINLLFFFLNRTINNTIVIKYIKNEEGTICVFISLF